MHQGGIFPDRQARLSIGLRHVFAAGDVASSVIDGIHSTVMSCQFARPMGRFAGHNVVADLFSLPMLPLQIDSYVTVLDLGAWGALYTVGWDRQVHAVGASAKMNRLSTASASIRRELVAVRIFSRRPRLPSRSERPPLGPPEAGA